MSKANLFSRSSIGGVSSMAVDLVGSAVRALLGPGTLDERISDARHRVKELGSLGLREALLRERFAEQSAVRNWVQAHQISLQVRSATPPKRGSMSEPTRVRIYRRDAFILDFLDAEIAALTAEVSARLQAHAPILDRLDSIPRCRVARGRAGAGGGGARGGALPHRGAPGVVGGRVPRQQRERGQAPQRPHAQGQRLVTGCAG
jgi:hypothetical protein